MGTQRRCDGTVLGKWGGDMIFRVGQKVVCIDAVADAGKDWSGWAPVQGQIYTVTGFGKNPFNHELRICIAEISHPWGYKPNRFRPAVSRKTDISMLRRLLVPGAKIHELT